MGSQESSKKEIKRIFDKHETGLDQRRSSSTASQLDFVDQNERSLWILCSVQTEEYVYT